MRLQGLPAPDAIGFTGCDGQVCVVTDDATDLTVELVFRLVHRGWTVAVLSFSGTLDSAGPERFPDGVMAVEVNGIEERDVAEALGAIRSRYGDMSVCIYCAPRTPGDGAGDAALDLTHRTHLRVAFLIAKGLQTSLTQSARSGHASFITVTAMDGELGLSGRWGSAPITGGLAGLTKTLRLEWPEVFCRAIDLDPEIDAARGADLILGELLDPNRLISEVGHGPSGRVTLVTELWSGVEDGRRA